MLRRTLELEKEIEKIQKSTKTLINFFAPLHNWLRMKSKPYYNWSLKPYARFVHWAILCVFIAFCPLLFLSLFQNPPASRADNTVTYDTPRWETLSPAPTSNNFFQLAACPDDNSFWATTDGGEVIKSTDGGITWKQQYIDGSNTLKTVVCYSSTKILIASGADILQYNPSNGTWARRFTAKTNITSIDASSKFFLATADKTFYYSNDGSTWNSGSVGTTPNGSCYVEALGDKYLSYCNASTPEFFYSANGIDWIRAETQPSIEYFAKFIATSSGRLLAVGYNASGGAIYFSDDGSNWNQASFNLAPQGTDQFYDTAMSPSGRSIVYGKHHVYYSDPDENGSYWHQGTDIGYNNAVVASTPNGKFAGTGDSTILYSNDGATWAASTLQPTSTQNFTRIAANNSGNVVAVGWRGIIYYSNQDSLQTWNTAQIQINPSSPPSLTSAAITASGTIATLSGDGKIYYFKDNTWSQATIPLSPTINKIITTSSGHLLAIGLSRYIFQSTDGINWSQCNLDIAWNSLNSGMPTIQEYSPGRFVVLGKGTIYYSNDEINWTKATLSVSTTNYITKIAMSGGTLVALSNLATYSTTTDNLANWIQVDSVSYTLNDLTITPTGTFVVVGNSGHSKYSINGSVWTDALLSPLTLNNLTTVVSASTGVLVATGPSGDIYYSSNGQIWNKADVSISSVNGLVVSPSGKFVIVSSNSLFNASIYSSDDGNNWSLGIITGDTGNDWHSTYIKIIALSNRFVISSGYNIIDSIDGINWTKRSLGLGPGFGMFLRGLNSYSINNLSYAFAVGDNGILSYFHSPANATASQYAITLPGQQFVTGSGIIGNPGAVHAGDSISINAYAIDSNNTLDPSNVSVVGIESTDPKANNPAPFQLTPTGCNQTSIKPCGQGSTSISFHTAGIWKIKARDINGGLPGTFYSSDVTVLPGNPHHPRFLSSSISSPSGVAKQVTIGLADQFNNATSDPDGKTIHLTSSSSSALFSTDVYGPWNSSLELPIPTGNSTIDSNANKTASFYYLDFDPTTSTITAFDSADPQVLQSSTLPVTITPGLIDQNASSVTLSSSSIKAGKTITAAVTVSTTTLNPGVSLVSSRGDKDQITKLSESGNTATFSITSTTSGSVTLFAKDIKDDTWLESSPTFAISPDTPSYINLSFTSNPSASKISVIAGDTFGVKAEIYDRYGNLADNSTSTLAFSSTDPQAVLPSHYKLISTDAGVFVFTVTLKTSNEQRIKVSSEYLSSEKVVVVNPSLFSPTTSTFYASKQKLILAKDKANLQVKISDQFGNGIPEKEVSINVDSEFGEINSSAAKTDSSGLISFRFIPMKVGSLTLSAYNITDKQLVEKTVSIDILQDTLPNTIASLADALRGSLVAKKMPVSPKILLLPLLH